VTLALLVSLVASSADAAAPVAAIEYVAPAECPSSADFLAQVAARTAGRWRVRATAGPGDYLVEIRDAGAGAEKTGRVRRGAGGAPSREITAADCDDLVKALALSTALSLDQAAELPAPPISVARAAKAVPPPASWIVGGGVAETSLFEGQTMPAASLFVENGRRLWPTGLGLRRPDVRVAISYARNDLAGGDRARFALGSGGVTVCPAGAGLGAAVSLRLCPGAEVGLLSGEGIAVAMPSSSRFLWAAAGAVARLRWAPGARVAVEAQAGLVAPLVRTTFVFEMPRLEVARIPAVVAAGGVAIGFTIP
jgi:hypothetical protein